MNLIDHLEELRGKATQGLWLATESHNFSDTWVGYLRAGGGCIAQSRSQDEAESNANLALIAAMHRALPLLLNAVRAAKEVRDRIPVCLTESQQEAINSLHEALQPLFERTTG